MPMCYNSCFRNGDMPNFTYLSPNPQFLVPSHQSPVTSHKSFTLIMRSESRTSL